VADTKISALAALTGANVAAGDLATLVDVSDTTMAASGTNKKITIDELVIALQARGMPRVMQLTAQHAISSTTPTKVTGLDLTLEAGTFIFEYWLIVQSATSTVAPQFNFNFTGTATTANWWYEYADTSATLLAAIGSISHNVTTQTLGFGMRQSENTEATTAAGNMGPAQGVQTANTDILVMIRGLLEVTVSGNMELWHGSETATATSVEVGSSLKAIRTA
jgi:hypothetical protein